MPLSLLQDPGALWWAGVQPLHRCFGSHNMAQDRPAFTYTKLDGEHDSRLLRLTHTTDDKIECVLEHTSTKERPPDEGYFALSYVWGEGAQQPIYVNGQSFGVSPNLLAALRACYRFLSACGSLDRGIWIDAICINQKDAEEKSKQVQRMDTIFSEAERVLVWWGDGNADGDQSMMRAFNALKWMEMRHDMGILGGASYIDKVDELKRPEVRYRVAKVGLGRASHIDVEQDVGMARYEGGVFHIPEAFKPLVWEYIRCEQKLSATDVQLNQIRGLYAVVKVLKTRHCGYLRHRVQRMPTLDQCFEPEYSGASKLIPGPENRFWADLLSLLSIAWFERIWTFQEIVLAKRATVLFGPSWVEWSTFTDSLRLFHMDSFWSSHIGAGAVTNAIKRQRRQALIGILVVSDIHRYRTLSVALIVTLPRKASDPRDYVYGLLSILPAKTRAAIKVDYRQSVADVYKTTVRAICKEPNKNHFWFAMENCAKLPPSRLPGEDHGSDLMLPSWCPDFGASRSRYSTRYDVSLVDAVPGDAWAWRHKDLTRIRVSPDADIMLMDGVRIGRVKRSAAAALPEHLGVAGDSIVLTTAVVQLYAQWLVDMIQLFRLTDACSESTENDPGKRWRRDYLSDADVGLIEAARIAFSHLSTKTNAESSATYASDMPPLARLTLRIMEMWAKSTGGKYFFLTEDDRIGVATTPVHPDDTIVYAGGHRLVILSRDCGRFVALASVEGLMNEDLIGRLKSEKDLETFVLE